MKKIFLLSGIIIFGCSSPTVAQPVKIELKNGRIPLEDYSPEFLAEVLGIENEPLGLEISKALQDLDIVQSLYISCPQNLYDKIFSFRQAVNEQNDSYFGADTDTLQFVHILEKHAKKMRNEKFEEKFEPLPWIREGKLWENEDKDEKAEPDCEHCRQEKIIDEDKEQSDTDSLSLGYTPRAELDDEFRSLENRSVTPRDNTPENPASRETEFLAIQEAYD